MSKSKCSILQKTMRPVKIHAAQLSETAHRVRLTSKHFLKSPRSVQEAVQSMVTIGTPICQNRGQANSSLFEAEEFFTTHDGEWWTVPVIGGGGNCDPKNPTQVVNWAKIKPTDYNTKGNPRYIIADVMCGPKIINEAAGSLCFSHRFVREPGKGY